MTYTRPESTALANAALLSSRLTDPLVANSSQTSQSLADGAAGIALLHIERARTGHGDWSTAHAWLATAASTELSADTDACLYFGAPALALATHAAADRPRKLTKALAKLDASTITITHHRLSQAHDRIDRGARPALGEFDLIRGLTGLGAYHLRRHPHHDITRAVLTYLVRLTEPLPGPARDLPGWWTHHGPYGQRSPECADGHGNNGLAHGVTGPLALLSLALRRGIVVDSHAEAIGRICAWLDTWQQQHPHGPWWPRITTRQELHTGHTSHTRPGQPSWCYGTPGIARAQQLAALANDDAARCHMAENALLGCLNDPTQLDQLTEPGLCHGMAGLTQTTWRISVDAANPDIDSHLPKLISRLLHHTPPVGDAGLLTGTAGFALALHTLGAGAEPATSWDACLLLA